MKVTPAHLNDTKSLEPMELIKKNEFLKGDIYKAEICDQDWISERGGDNSDER